MENNSPIIKSLFVEITNRCNLKCKHCYNNSGGAKNDQIPLSIVSNIIGEARTLGVAKICISGGEPFLHHDISAIIRTCDEAEIQTQLITNGLLLSNYLPELLRTRYISLQISIDGTELSHDILRGKGAFSRTDSSIRAIHGQIPWNLKCTINNYNKDDVKSIIEYGILNKALIVSFSLINNQGRAKINPELLLDTDSTIEVIKTLSLLKSEYSKEIIIEYPSINCNNQCPFSQLSPGEIAPRIDANGNVFCCSVFDNKCFSLGNICSSSISDIIASDKARNVFDLIRVFYKTIDCTNCFMNSDCKKGCIGEFLNNLPIYNDGFCGVRKKNILNAIVHSKKTDKK